MSGEGRLVVNDKEGEVYFPRLGDLEAILAPLSAAGQERAKYDVTVLVKGGGVTGQTESVHAWACTRTGQDEPGLGFCHAQRRFPDPRCARQGTQETRPQESPQGPDLHQTLTIVLALYIQT